MKNFFVHIWGFLLVSSYAFINNFSVFPSTCSHQKMRSSQRQGWFDNLFPAPTSDEDRRIKYPEQYPATYELLNPLPNDQNDARIVRPLLKQTQLENRPLRLAFDARKQGWNARAFHRAVDGKGAAIIIAKGKDSPLLFGGYNPKGWSGMSGARPSVAAFLWYETNTGNYQKLQKVGGGGLACANDDIDTGIWLGADGLVIPLTSGREKLAQSKLGTYFERGPDDRRSLFPTGSTELVELKVLVGVYNRGEEIPYSGAVLDFTSG